MKKNIKEVEKSVLETFQEEVPSIYYSDKTVNEFEQYKAKASYMYRDLFKFPPKMFDGCDLIDFGAGTGENTVYLANWGARCTLVEMNEKAQKISREVFCKYAKNYKEHRFICSSIFDYNSSDKYDVVHCRGVLSHTDDKEGAFSKIASFLKPGGYLIFGDPNKVGGFQNMLQRYVIYKFASNWDDMVKISEQLFKEDIDRAQKFGNRTRRCIIFDRWVVQQQDDPSVKEVLQWGDDNGLILYSSYPPITFPFLSDSVHHTPKFNLSLFKDIGVLTEAAWMVHNKDDKIEIPKVLKSFKNFSEKQSSLTDYIADCNKDTVIDVSVIKKKIEEYLRSFKEVEVTSYLMMRVKGLLEEVKKLLYILEEKDIKKVDAFIKQAKYLFRGAVGVRHVDFIFYKK